jgi:hypothetical protein
MSNKLIDNKRRNHSEKILQKMSKKAAEPSEKKSSSSSSRSSEKTLREQYEIIRKDVLKLREDLTKGYDMAKGLVEKKGFLTQLLKTR